MFCLSEILCQLMIQLNIQNNLCRKLLSVIFNKLQYNLLIHASNWKWHFAIQNAAFINQASKRD